MRLRDLFLAVIPLAALSAASCKKKVDADAMELSETFRAPTGSAMRYWSCTFVANNHGFKVAYATPESAIATDAAALRKIANAVRVTP